MEVEVLKREGIPIAEIIVKFVAVVLEGDHSVSRVVLIGVESNPDAPG